MNKKGATFILAFMIGVICFFLGLALTNPLKEVVVEQMDDATLNCTTTTDSYSKAVCTSMDMFIPLFGGVIFGLAGMVLTRMII